MQLTKCEKEYQISSWGANEKTTTLGTAKVGDIFIVHVAPGDDLNTADLYHQRCWLLLDNDDQVPLAKAAHFVELAQYVWFRNFTHES